MQSFSHELQNFSRARLKKQSTRITMATGKILVETRSDDNDGYITEVADESAAYGFVQDMSLDLQVGVITPFLLLSSQDAASDMETLKKFKVSHVLNVACGVSNSFPEQFIYETVPITDLPETQLTSYLPQCFEFIDNARKQDGIVLLHCNAGVSRSASVAIAYLMAKNKLPFQDAFHRVKSARPSIQPNAGFLIQLKEYQP
ncbi:dual specificity protein phosphatase 19b [Tachysurus fulvidraco]|uniref:dual specificity protein phosphatase 19b n=1 Tax=Tachysurus fulvidraco TaxID=1234273 RepID=UPI001FEF96B0|nr:dual specificity protein phosphatase 19b [Tachysurus fulvidraco]